VGLLIFAFQVQRGWWDGPGGGNDTLPDGAHTRIWWRTRRIHFWIEEVSKTVSRSKLNLSGSRRGTCPVIPNLSGSSVRFRRSPPGRPS
jgi:hypothetical protein